MENAVAINTQTEASHESNPVKYVYYVSTGLLTLIMAASVGNYLFHHDFIRGELVKMGYPTYIIYPLAVAKVSGVIAVWTRKSALLTGLAYAGFFYNFVLAFFAHVMISDSGQWPAAVALVALVTSYLASQKLFRN